MLEPLRWVGQGAFFAIVAAFVGLFATWPSYRQFPDEKAQIKLSLSHGAQRAEACRRLTAAEIAALPPSERRPNTCSRERLPVQVQLLLDGVLLYDAVVEPGGLAGDGPARIYRKLEVSPGRREIIARLKDSDRPTGFDYETRAEVTLLPQQSLAIDFRADSGGFVLR
jgi:hypothetical protein